MGGRARRVTASDIARSLGISRATVGFVINDTPGQTISEATRRKVLAEAARLGYRPHAAARALARGSNRIVLFILPDWPVEHSLRRYLEEATLVLDRAGYSLVTWTRHAGGRSRPLWETLDPDLVVPVLPLPRDDLDVLRREAGARLLLGGDEPSELHEVPSLRAGPALQVDHLHERGHARLAVALTDDPRLELLAGLRASLARARAAELGLEIADVRTVSGEDGSAADAVRDWVDAGVTGVVAYNDDIGAAVVGAAVRAGIAVPGRLAVVGHDDSPLARLLVPALTSVRVDVAGLGRYAAHRALHALGVEETPPAEPDVRAGVVHRETS
ncbi:LacI family DNA-binding transcriptional regulator [Nonomuraea angiospora]|uniref:DNA-binding LacI/PurR family transcriptional regulator n=1 Tax=Nonomuraea angiospora TaxID=46172 RepID=A0ABR9LSF7_9ACTN|nr:LacI family DNA-binding transcriptional regulator [Nonomuraea angiospora]MBE1583320.1 DNA-binding LacI/PurR family transcriptional regulator [Nonomuraea angiospora]